MGSEQDGILGIVNRTENWKTAQLVRLSDAGKVALVRKLGEPNVTPADDVRIELFWYGVRDGKPDLEGADAVAIYHRRFADLRQRIIDFKGQPHKFRPLQGHNYRVSPETQNDFYENLQNTEIDIVVETPQHLFIGEAKQESGFGGSGKLILVHQLVRQFVTATILLDLIGKSKQVVPFVVADYAKLDSVNSTAQVAFMVDQGWLKQENVLSWRDIDAIKEGTLQGR